MDRETVANTFAKGPEGWCSYDYRNHLVGGSGFIMSRWVPMTIYEQEDALGMILTNHLSGS